MNALTSRTSARMVADEMGPAQTCAHCGQPIPEGAAHSAAPARFCCNGCQTAFQLIHQFGLDSFYDLSKSTVGTAVGDDLNVESFDDLNSPEFLERFTTKLTNDTCQAKFGIQGVHCFACVWLIEKLPQMERGVISATLHWGNSTLDLVWDPNVTQLSNIAFLLRRLGYRLSPIRFGERQLQRTLETRAQLLRLGVAGAAAGNNMLIALGLYFGWFSGMEASYQDLLRYASCFLGLISLLGPGMVFFKSAWAALKTRSPHMDLPIALGLGAGGLGGLFNTVTGTGEIYFDSLGVLVFLLLVGRFIQFRQQSRSADAVELLYQLTPRKARRLVNGRLIDTHADLLKPGDVVQVLAGELVPADGVVIEGLSCFDESILTGESAPRKREISQLVAAGTTNLDSAVTLRVVAVGANTRIGKLTDLIERAAAEKPEIVQWANRIGGQFVLVVMLLALIAFGVWYSQGITVALDHAIALLIVACPCALAMATPLALAIGLGRGARRGILIKSGDVLQRLNRPGLLWLDKTGTVTQGRMQLVHWVGETRWLDAVGAIEQHSSHPIANALNPRSIAEFLGYEKLDLDRSVPDATEVVQTSGGGIEGSIQGESVFIGNQRFIQSRTRLFEPQFEEAVHIALGSGLTPVIVATEEKVVGVASVGDPIRADSREKIDRLAALGWRIGMLSGDHPEVVSRVAAQLGIPKSQAFGGLLPEDKVEHLRQQERHLTQVMIGDGVNDSAALAMASVGIAVHGGSEVSMQAAPVYLNQPGLGSVLELMDLSRNTMQTIKLNLAISLFYNLLAVGLAMVGVINPLIAAALMPVSSLSVVSQTWLRPSFRKER